MTLQALYLKKEMRKVHNGQRPTNENYSGIKESILCETAGRISELNNKDVFKAVFM